MSNLKYSNAFKEHISNIIYENSVCTNISFLEIELTGRCLNSCEYCGVGAPVLVDLPISPLLLFMEQWISYVHKKRQIPIISLTGGDPLLYPYIEHLIQKINHYSIDYMLKTNPHSINSNIDNFKKKPSAVKFTIPDSINDGRNRDKIENLIAKTNYLYSQAIDVIWQASVHNGNIDDLLLTIQNIDIQVPITLAVGRILPINSNIASKYPISSKRYTNFLERLIPIYYSLYKKGVTLRIKENLWIPILDKYELLPNLNNEISSQCCDCFQEQLSIDRNGFIFPCGLMRKTIIGNISNSPKELFNIRSSIMKLENHDCYFCKYFKYCGGGCLGASESITGSIYNCDPHCQCKTIKQNFGYKE